MAQGDLILAASRDVQSVDSVAMGMQIIAALDEAARARLLDGLGTEEVEVAAKRLVGTVLVRVGETERRLDDPMVRPLVPPRGPTEDKKKFDFIGLRLVDGAGKPVPRVRYRLTLPNGSQIAGQLDNDGAAHHSRVLRGDCFVEFELGVEGGPAPSAPQPDDDDDDETFDEAEDDALDDGDIDPEAEPPTPRSRPSPDDDLPDEGDGHEDILDD